MIRVKFLILFNFNTFVTLFFSLKIYVCMNVLSNILVNNKPDNSFNNIIFTSNLDQSTYRSAGKFIYHKFITKCRTAQR